MRTKRQKTGRTAFDRGQQAEMLVKERLLESGYTVEKMGYSDHFDFLVNGHIRLEVKSSALKNGRSWSFGVGLLCRIHDSGRWPKPGSVGQPFDTIAFVLRRGEDHEILYSTYAQVYSLFRSVMAITLTQASVASLTARPEDVMPSQ